MSDMVAPFVRLAIAQGIAGGWYRAASLAGEAPTARTPFETRLNRRATAANAVAPVRLAIVAGARDSAALAAFDRIYSGAHAQ